MCRTCYILLNLPFLYITIVRHQSQVKMVRVDWIVFLSVIWIKSVNSVYDQKNVVYYVITITFLTEKYVWTTTKSNLLIYSYTKRNIKYNANIVNDKYWTKNGFIS